jgi:N-acetylmuramoyl-L-alanine amidase
MARTSIAGIEYVRLDHWAEARNFQFRWTVPRKEARLASTWSALAFTVDSRRCLLNGVVVWLSYPVALQNGAVWIASADLATAINPVLFPGRNPAAQKIRTICIDAGHGGKDPGNRDGRQQEKTYTLLLARELARQLSAAGFKVTQTRSGDSFVDLDMRPELARRRGADLFLSLHFNSAGPGGRSVQGAEVYCLTPARASSTNARGEGAGTGAFPGNQHNSKNMLLSYQMQKALVHRLGTQDRGVKRARFAVLRPAAMPTVLIEAGFMTNPAEAKRIYDAAYRRRMAAAIVEGVLAYRKAVEP